MRLTIRQMIKLMTVGFLGLAVLSCSKGDNQIEYEKPMEFSGYTARSVTKANGSFVTGVELPAGQAFGVYVYNTGESDEFDPAKVIAEQNAYPKFMTNVAVTYNGRGASAPANYEYATRYWPNSEESNRLAFFAYYPHDGADITKSGFADFIFKVQDNPANQVDLMLSNVVPNQMYSHTNSTAGVVNLNFHHMLTRVLFKCKTDAPDGATVKIKNITLEGVYNKGTLAPNVTAALSEWTPDETSATPFTIFDGLKELGTTAKSLPTQIALASTATEDDIKEAEDNDAFLMIPQTLSDDVKLSITYSITTTTSSGSRTITETVEFVLNTAKTAGDPPLDITEWERNKQIVYTLNIGLNLIEISASATDWTNNGEDGDSITIE